MDDKELIVIYIPLLFLISISFAMFESFESFRKCLDHYPEM